jgi:hypothetical protein
MPHKVPNPAESQQEWTHLKPGGQSLFFLHGSATEHERGATQKQQSPTVTKQKQDESALQAGKVLQTPHAAVSFFTAFCRQIFPLFAAVAVAVHARGVPKAIAPAPPYFNN